MSISFGEIPYQLHPFNRQDDCRYTYTKWTRNEVLRDAKCKQKKEGIAKNPIGFFSCSDYTQIIVIFISSVRLYRQLVCRRFWSTPAVVRK